MIDTTSPPESYPSFCTTGPLRGVKQLPISKAGLEYRYGYTPATALCVLSVLLDSESADLTRIVKYILFVTNYLTET
jgi:hypothetical protein